MVKVLFSEICIRVPLCKLDIMGLLTCGLPIIQPYRLMSWEVSITQHGLFLPALPYILLAVS